MKRMIDQASFEKASSDIKEIQDLLSGKAFFDGSVTVETIGGDKGIKKANLPTESGVYKLSSGVLIVKVNSASSITITALYGASMYAETRDPASTSNFLFNENTRLGEKPIYFHPIRFDINGTVGGGTIGCHVKSGAITILNNDPVPLDTYTKLHDYLYNEGNAIDILCAIDFFDNAGYKGQILKLSAFSSRITVMYTTDGTTTNTDSFISSEFTIVSDSVNRIN